MDYKQQTYRSYAEAVSEGNTNNEYFGDTGYCEDSKDATDATKDTELVKYIENTKQKIERGYNVIDFTPDGCDSDGFMYWAECENGETFRDWEVPTEIEKAVKKAQSLIHKYGYSSNGSARRYYTKSSLDKVFFPKLHKT